MKNVFKQRQNLIILIPIIIGIFLLVKEAKFYIDLKSGNYEKIQATIVDYRKSTSTSRGKNGRCRTKTTYYKIYEYEYNGKVKRYESSFGSNQNIGSIGDKEYLYRNKKTNKVREKASKMMLLAGIVFSGGGIIALFNVYRKMN